MSVRALGESNIVAVWMGVGTIAVIVCCHICACMVLLVALPNVEIVQKVFVALLYM
jgi:hypothetical protein